MGYLNEEPMVDIMSHSPININKMIAVAVSPLLT
jgi:hypothetical protein